MAFNLRIVFTGVCALLPDVPFATGSATKVFIVMPNAWSTTKVYGPSSGDKSDLMRHRPFIKFSLVNAGLPAGISNGDGVWYLDKALLTFKPTGGNNPFKLGNLDSLLRLEDVATSKYASIDPDAIRTAAAQAFLDTGEISAETTFGTWVFPNTLTGGKLRVGKIATEFVVRYKSVDKFSLIVTPFAGTPVELPLVGAPDATIDVTVADLCDDNPLRWQTEWDYLPPDEDFKWYFEMLTPAAKDTLPGDLSGLPLPIPYFKDKLNGQGANCFPVEMKPSVA